MSETRQATVQEKEDVRSILRDAMEKTIDFLDVTYRSDILEEDEMEVLTDLGQNSVREILECALLMDAEPEVLEEALKRFLKGRKTMAEMSRDISQTAVARADRQSDEFESEIEKLHGEFADVQERLDMISLRPDSLTRGSLISDSQATRSRRMTPDEIEESVWRDLAERRREKANEPRASETERREVEIEEDGRQALADWVQRQDRQDVEPPTRLWSRRQSHTN